MRQLCKVALALLLLILMLLAGIAGAGLHDDIAPSDVAIVPGSKIMPDGTPSDRLRARLDRAADLYQQGMFAHVIVSGGTGVEGFSEARVMARYLVERRAVPSAAILLDEHGDTTDATARNSAVIMQAHGLRSALVVTQYFHVARCRYVLRQAGISTVHSAHAHYFEARDFYSTARELVALPAYWIRGLRQR